jgi:outer membrane protein assembly factor BamA
MTTLGLQEHARRNSAGATTMAFVMILLLFVSSPSLHAQDTPPPPPNDTLGIVDTIIVSGNEKTKAYVILDEMAVKPGSVATLKGLEFDRNRIYSLGLFTRVDMYYDSLEGTRFLNVDVGERWYIIPVPLFGFRDGDPKRPFFGGGLLHNNVAGRNQKLFAAIVFGYNPSASLFFSDPLISRDHTLFFSGNLSFSRVRNKSKIASATTGDFDEQHYDIDITLGRRLSLYETAALTLGYQIVRIEEYEPGRTVSPTGRDNFLMGTLSYTYDSRDLREYASTGNFASLFVTKYGFGESVLSFTRLGVDLRRYTPIPLNLTLATRLHTTLTSGGAVPTYARMYFGYGERIRGHFSTVFEGENLAGSTVELRFPLMAPQTFVFRTIPLPPEFSVWRFGVSLEIFAEAGAAWFGQKVQWKSFSSGYGGGLAFLLPYGYVVRTEYAFDEYRKGQFILDLRGSI